ncbi:hypothetical protein [Halorubrum amylolyticum]|uniref:hypothetical protein n=1 Tax=Halorubrum amylolyticum TaxID=2508724 RepID=UPI001008D4B6|nr:hypothetical protein [Halorubrum amylolyticum]
MRPRDGPTERRRRWTRNAEDRTDRPSPRRTGPSRRAPGRDGGPPAAALPGATLAVLAAVGAIAALRGRPVLLATLFAAGGCWLGAVAAAHVAARLLARRTAAGR